MKVFCVGTWKTGTTSMGRALHKIMGGEHQKWEHKNRMLYLNGEWDEIWKISRRHRTFDDTPWNCFDVWPKMKDRYQTSKFILTLREEEEWFTSMVRWYKDNLNTFRRSKIVKRVYKKQLSHFNFNLEEMCILSQSKDKWIEWYHLRNEEVKKSFKDSNRLLIYNITKEHGWDLLCNFLGKEIPLEPFPHLNKGK
jgi:hypothetical protein